MNKEQLKNEALYLKVSNILKWLASKGEITAEQHQLASRYIVEKYKPNVVLI